MKFYVFSLYTVVFAIMVSGVEAGGLRLKRRNQHIENGFGTAHRILAPPDSFLIEETDRDRERQIFEEVEVCVVLSVVLLLCCCGCRFLIGCSLRCIFNIIVVRCPPLTLHELRPSPLYVYGGCSSSDFSSVNQVSASRAASPSSTSSIPRASKSRAASPS